MSDTFITSAEVRCDDGRLAATINYVQVGGGEQIVNVDGQLETRIHAGSVTYHVRLISPDRMLSDTLRDASTYDDAVALGVAYAERLEAHAEKLEALSADLTI